MKKIRLDFSPMSLYNIQNSTSIQMKSVSLSKRKAQIKRMLKNYYEVKDLALKGTMADLILVFEQRLDMVLVRMNLARSLLESRQLINHGLVKVNSRILTSPGFSLKPGDHVEASSQPFSSSSVLWEEFWGIPSYLEVNFSSCSGIFLRLPVINELPLPFDVDFHLPLSINIITLELNKKTSES